MGVLDLNFCLLSRAVWERVLLANTCMLCSLAIICHVSPLRNPSKLSQCLWTLYLWGNEASDCCEEPPWRRLYGVTLLIESSFARTFNRLVAIYLDFLLVLRWVAVHYGQLINENSNWGPTTAELRLKVYILLNFWELVFVIQVCEPSYPYYCGLKDDTVIWTTWNWMKGCDG